MCVLNQNQRNFINCVRNRILELLKDSCGLTDGGSYCDDVSSSVLDQHLAALVLNQKRRIHRSGRLQLESFVCYKLVSTLLFLANFHRHMFSRQMLLQNQRSSDSQLIGGLFLEEL